MKTERADILLRGLAGRCPNCDQPTLFQPGRHLRINRQCRACGLGFDRGDGFFLGPFVLNYGVTVFGFVLPVIAAHSLGHIGAKTTFALVTGGSCLLPILLYRQSWKWWLAGYFCLMPDKLPSNRTGLPEDQED